MFDIRSIQKRTSGKGGGDIMFNFYKNIITVVIVFYFKTVDKKKLVRGVEPPKKNPVMTYSKSKVSYQLH